MRNMQFNWKENRILLEDRGLNTSFSYGVDTDGDGKINVVVVGTRGPTKLVKDAKTITVEDPEINKGQSYGIDVDNDGKAEWCRTRGKG